MVNEHGQPLKPVYPPEYFSDMASHHKKEFFAALKTNAGHWQLVRSLPCLDAAHFGQKLGAQQYEDYYDSSLETFFRNVFTLHDGELLGVEAEWEPGFHDKAFDRDCVHIQYALSKPQREHMKYMELPGTQSISSPSGSAAIGARTQPLTWAEFNGIGTTLVTRLDPPATKKAKVVTWPQLFHLGAIHNFSAMEIFSCGCHMELMLSRRDRSKSSPESQDAGYIRYTNSGKWGHDAE